MSQAMARQEIHDRLLQNMPEGATHDTATCPLCANGETAAAIEPTGASVEEDAVSTITQEQLDAAVTAASAAEARVVELETKVKAFEESQREGAIEAAVAEAQAEAQTKIDELQTQLDAAVLEANTTKEAFEAFKTELADAQAAIDAEASIEAKRDERVAKVAEVASFPQEYVDANADRWAAMTDEAFDQVLEDWRQIAARAPGEKIPAKTGLHASRETDQASGTAMKEVFGLIRSGHDTRN